MLLCQHLRNKHPDVRLVVDDEHRFTKAALDNGVFRYHVGIECARVPRKVDAHRRALADFRIDPDLPAGLPDEAVDHRKAQACSLSERLGCEERIEGLGNDIRRHPGAGVGDAER